MIKMTHLDKDDICSIIAHHFDVPYEDVMIDCYMELMEYEGRYEPSVRAVVTTYNSKKKEIENSVISWIYLEGDTNEKKSR